MNQARSPALPLAWRALVAWFVLLTAVAAVQPLAVDATLSDSLYFIVAFGSVLATLVAKLISKLKTGAWRGHWLMVLFLLLQSAGGFIQAWADSHNVDSRVLGWHDLAFTSAYGFALIFTVTTALPLRVDGRRAVVADGSLLVLGLALIGYQFLLVPSIEAHAALDPQSRPEILRLWYPCCAYLTVAALLAAGPATRLSRLSYLLMLCGWAVWAGAESGFHLTTLSVAEPTWYAKIGWLMGYVLIAAGVCADDRDDARPQEHAAPAIRLGSSTLFAVFSWLAVAATLVSLHFNGRKLDLVVLMGVALILALMMFRLVWASEKVSALSEQVSHLRNSNPETQTVRLDHFLDWVDESLGQGMLARYSLILLELNPQVVAGEAALDPGALARRVVAALQQEGMGSVVAQDDAGRFLFSRSGLESDEDVLAYAWCALAALQRVSDGPAAAAGGAVADMRAAVATAPNDGSSAARLYQVAQSRLSGPLQSGPRVNMGLPSNLGLP